MDYIALAIPVFFILMAAEFIGSAVTKKKLYRFNDFVNNISLGIGSQLVGGFLKTFVVIAYFYAYENWRFFTLETTLITWFATFLLVDFAYYWFHRLSHEVNAMWAAHIVHHQSEEYNLSVALRQSWFQGFFSWPFYLPLALFGIHPVTILTVGAFNTLYQFWIHTRTIKSLGFLELFLNTPSHHRVHHGSNPKYIDKNHAGSLIIWDKMFGTFKAEEEEPVYGITTQLKSWNPIYANFHYWIYLFKTANQSKGIKNKISVFLKPPGWYPEELGGMQFPKEVDKNSYQRYNADAPKSLYPYLWFSFLVLLPYTTYYLFNQGNLVLWQSVTYAGVIIMSMVSYGALFECKPWVKIFEGFRLLIFYVFLFGFLNENALFNPYLLSTLAALNFVGYWFIIKKLPNEHQETSKEQAKSTNLSNSIYS
ncbi:MAG: sterol desaturase family protein [Luteibaculaceae bacterium]